MTDRWNGRGGANCRSMPWKRAVVDERENSRRNFVGMEERKMKGEVGGTFWKRKKEEGGIEERLVDWRDIVDSGIKSSNELYRYLFRVPRHKYLSIVASLSSMVAIVSRVGRRRIFFRLFGKKWGNGKRTTCFSLFHFYLWGVFNVNRLLIIDLLMKIFTGKSNLQNCVRWE